MADGMDYHQRKRALLAAVAGIGRAVQIGEFERGMNAAQLKRRRGKNFMTDEVWQFRSLAGGAIRVELSYSWFLNAPLYGVSVWCVGNLRQDADAWDHSLSGAFHTIEDVAGRLAVLESGGLERIAALAAKG